MLSPCTRPSFSSGSLVVVQIRLDLARRHGQNLPIETGIWKRRWTVVELPSQFNIQALDQAVDPRVGLSRSCLRASSSRRIVGKKDPPFRFCFRDLPLSLFRAMRTKFKDRARGFFRVFRYARQASAAMAHCRPRADVVLVVLGPCSA